MPLKDHAALRDEVQWGTFHQNWVVKIVDRLNETVLSDRYRSESHAHLGRAAEVDIGTLEQAGPASQFESANGHHPGGLAVAPAVYAPPAPPLTGPAGFADAGVFEVRVRRGRWDLVAAVELVSERNKDRPAARREVAVKCASYLHAGVSLVVVDADTERLADLHGELCDLLAVGPALRWASPTGLAVVSYRTAKPAADAPVRLDAWPFPLAVGQELPTVPLWLAADLAVPLELEWSYRAACRSLRLA